MKPIIFFDGICAVCNKIVDFILKRDQGIFLFAPLQGTTAKEKLSPGLLGSDLKTLVLLDEKGVHTQSIAMLRIFSRLKSPWKAAVILKVIPPRLMNIFYNYFSAHRYKWFGKYDVCRIPTLEEKNRFLG